MKQLFGILFLLTFVCACNESPAPYTGSLRNLVPQQVGSFKLKGELKPAPIVPEGQSKSGALRPVEGLLAQYETSGGAPLTVQVTNYSSVSDAGKAFKQMVANVVSVGNGAKVSESARDGKEAGRKTIIEGIAPGYHGALWTNTSVLFQVSGDNLKTVEEFERSFP